MITETSKVTEPRKIIGREMLDELELQAHLIRSVERYAYVRQWLYGNVLDCGCGTGYGSYMIAQNPDVACVVGFDSDRTAIEFAEREYQDEKLNYICEDVETFGQECETDFDGIMAVVGQFSEMTFHWLVAVELIEHLNRPEQLATLADKAKAERILLTYPSKKTTHYNPFHIADYNDEMITELFPKFRIYRSCDFHATHDTKIIFLERIEK